MSRIIYSSESDDVLDFGRWERNSKTTIKSKRGQKVLRDLEAALLALPDKRLIKNELCRLESGDAQYCVLGAYAAYKGVPNEDMFRYSGEGAEEIAWWASGQKVLDLAYTLAWNLIELNDESCEDDTPEQRYIAVLAWVQKKIIPINQGGTIQ